MITKFSSIIFFFYYSLSFLIFQKPARIKTLTYKQCLKSLILCAVLSLIWASMPLFGWSYYSLEGVKITCSVEWRDRSFNVISYNTTIFLFVFIIPLVILVVTNTKLILFVSINKDLKIYLFNVNLMNFNLIDKEDTKKA